MFPIKKRKVDEISPLHPALVSQPSPSPGTGGEDYATKATRKTGASLMDEPMNSETETCEKLGMEQPASPTKLSTSSLDRFRHFPLPIMTILRRDEEEEINPNVFMKPRIREPVLATSEKRDSGKRMVVSQNVFGLSTCGITYMTPSTFLSPSPAISGPPSTNARISTAMASIPSSKAHEKEVEVEVVKDSTSQGLAHDFSMPMEALALDQTDPRQSQAAPVTPVPDQIRKKIPTKSAPSVPPATTVVATSDISHIQTQFQYDKNLRTDLYNICNQNSESLLQRIEAYQSQVYKDVARLKEELENARSEKIAAFGRVGILEERLKEQTEKLQSECKRSQEIMASQRELFQENETLKSEMAKKDKDMMILKHNNTIVEKRNIDVEQRNTVLEDRIGLCLQIIKSSQMEFQKAK
ncbi:hypothetical protein PAHAL_2G052500 [Panicum hallii]|uniref:Uncharacterized protein n=1 Tax=Panicum hallii TaxID=206008 RepID=A0A2S3GW16_9POAL|nr:uncharacterized protein LOC112879777 isoform X2 [Panicum hallii]PAN09826.1 hypothetical protein PAHAL_2G052500 [Panicum hallii]